MDLILSQKITNPVLIDKYMMGTSWRLMLSPTADVLIPGIMQRIERAGVHSGDSIAVYPPFSINDMLKNVIECSEQALAMKTKGLVNIIILYIRTSSML